MASPDEKIDRRGFVADTVRVAGAVGLGGLAGLLAARKGQSEDYVWQIDPDICIGCRNCQSYCVLDISAVKAVQCHELCALCDVCTGYFPTQDFVLDTGAENQLCPTGAINRKFIQERAGERFFEYTIEESLCIGCGKCVEGCALMNGSLYLQVRHDRLRVRRDRCLNCNECAIAVACPVEAFCRVPADRPTLLKREARTALESRSQGLSEKLAKKLPAEEAKRLKRSLEKVRQLLESDARDFIQEKSRRT